jgi:hypothetical protein
MSKPSIDVPSRNRIFHIKKFLSDKEISKIIKKVHAMDIYDKGLNYESRSYYYKYMNNITKKIKLLGNKKINNILDIIDENSNTHATCYKNTDEGMESHYDGWSDWNLLISIGDSSDLITGRDKVLLNSGDIILFNGKIRHQVKIHKGKGIKGSKYRRITIQHRHYTRKSLTTDIINKNKYPPRFIS